MKKLILSILILMPLLGLAQNPSRFNDGIRLPNATQQDAVTRIPVMDVNGNITGYILKNSLELALGNPPTDGFVLSSTVAGVRSWVSGGGGHIIQDEGTPLTQRANLNFTGSGVTVTDDAGNDASIVTIGGGGSTAWGDITGTLSDQTDLDTELNNRALLTGGPTTQTFNQNVNAFTNITASGVLETAGLRAVPRATPIAATDGSIYYDSDTDQLFGFINGSPVDLGQSGGGGTDADAIHDNVAAEISVITEKVTPVSGDFLLIEDSADSNNKKRIQVGNLPGGDGTSQGIIASGTLTLTGLQSIYTINHNLGFVPANTRIQIQQLSVNSDAALNLENLTATTFDLSTAGTVTGDIAWRIFGTGTVLPSFGIIASGIDPLTSSGTTTINHNLGFVPTADRISVTFSKSTAVASGSGTAINNITDTSFDITIGSEINVSAAWKIFGAGNITPVVEGHVIEDEGTPLAQQGTIDFQGAGVTVTNDGANSQTVVTISGDNLGNHIATQNLDMSQSNILNTRRQTFTNSDGGDEMNFIFTSEPGPINFFNIRQDVGGVGSDFRYNITSDTWSFEQLEGTGTRMVVANNLGELSTQAIPGGGGTNGHVIEDDGVDETQRANLNIIGPALNVTDDAGNDRTTITLEASSGTGTAIPLTNVLGYYGDMGTPNAGITYTTTGTTLGSWAKIRINAASQPTVTGATLIDGADFIVSTDMYLLIAYNGSIAEYWFTQIAP